ncbi:MAG: ABC transporter permease, partial [Planctomycetes bacterium]|nr:ABC transporter permease [Planctomycetota bacterium]
MNLTALRMLLGDGAKYLALVVGLAFASTLVIQQGAIFLGFVEREGNAIDSIPEVDVWVMHPASRYYEEHPAFDEINLPRVRGVDGVAWAVPYLVTGGAAKLPDGSLISVQIIGADRVTRVGLPSEVVGGTQDLIEQPDAVFFDDLGIEIYQVVRAGDELEINDRRAVVAAKVTPRMTFTSSPMVYTTYERALAFAPGGRHRLTFILAKVQDGHDPHAVARDIENATGLKASPKQDFRQMTEEFFMKYTGVAVNFGITVLLGTLVGVAVAA